MSAFFFSSSDLEKTITRMMAIIARQRTAATMPMIRGALLFFGFSKGEYELPREEDIPVLGVPYWYLG